MPTTPFPTQGQKAPNYWATQLQDYIDESVDEIPKGDPGDSAYQVAVDNGFVGTESQWLASLKGADGTDGTNGTNGAPGEPGAPGADGTQTVVLEAGAPDPVDPQPNTIYLRKVV